MADPQRDLAPIIEPQAAPVPAPHADGGTTPALVLGVIVVGLALVAGFVRYRRRTAPLRQVRRLARATEPRAGADALAGLIAARSPAGLDPAWFGDLERLRFGRPGPDDTAVFARLCQDAERVLTRRR